MQASGQTEIAQDRERYLEAWGEMMLTIWKDKMDREQVGSSPRSSGELRDSLRYEVVKQSGGDTAKINHFFHYYGMYLDGGVFPGKDGVGQNYISNPNRKPKPWRGRSYWYYKMRLQEKLLEMTGKESLLSIYQTLTYAAK